MGRDANTQLPPTNNARARYRLKDSVYVAEEPLTGRYIAQRNGRAVLAELPLASHFRTHAEAALHASERLAGAPHEIVRVDQ